jgi:hypothetical protein
VFWNTEGLHQRSAAQGRPTLLVQLTVNHKGYDDDVS